MLQLQIHFVLNKGYSYLHQSNQHAQYTVNSCTKYYLPTNKQIISLLCHTRMHLNLMNEETMEKTKSKNRISVKEK